MLKPILTTALCLAISMSLLSSLSLATPASPAQSAFDKLVDEYFDFYFQFHPTAGTQAGLHQYDRKLEDFSRSAIDAEIAGAVRFQKQFASIESQNCQKNQPAILQILTSSIQRRFSNCKPFRCGEKMPMSTSIDPEFRHFPAHEQEFCPPADRLRSVISRERRIPRVLEEARQNISNPPRVYTEVALQQTAG